jgi:hypothetical protein
MARKDNLLANIGNGISAIRAGLIGLHLGMKPRVLDGQYQAFFRLDGNFRSGNDHYPAEHPKIFSPRRVSGRPPEYHHDLGSPLSSIAILHTKNSVLGSKVSDLCVLEVQWGWILT